MGLGVMLQQIRIGLSENIKISILWMIMHTRMSCACRLTRHGHSLLMRILDALQEQSNMLEGTESFYAYVVGADGKEYSITESIYSKTESAIEVIQKGKNIFYSRRRE